jgi:hypothetical protein
MFSSNLSESQPDIMQRRFQAYNLGIAKTGTTSMAGIFGKYRSRHEFMFQETTQAIADYKSDVITRDEFETFIIQRDKLGMLEMDSASFSFAYADILVEKFSSAKFVVTIRDCYSWLNSLLNLALHIGQKMPNWLVDYGQRALGIRVKADALKSREDFVRYLPAVIDGFLKYWANANTLLLETLPRSRTLIVRTHEISASIERLAQFIGVAQDTLLAERSHLFKARRKFGLLYEIDYGFLRDKCDQYCAGLMKDLFPCYNLQDFLVGEMGNSFSA